jgi:hypothetical protein
LKFPKKSVGRGSAKTKALDASIALEKTAVRDFPSALSKVFELPMTGNEAKVGEGELVRVERQMELRYYSLALKA